jgi:hypothetical protein
MDGNLALFGKLKRMDCSGGVAKKGVKRGVVGSFIVN